LRGFGCSSRRRQWQGIGKLAGFIANYTLGVQFKAKERAYRRNGKRTEMTLNHTSQICGLYN
jgi:hypothetical protein